METDRRNFIKFLAALGYALHSGKLHPAAAQAASGLRDPGRTGTLNADEKHELWTAFQYIGKTWKNEPFCQLSREGFEEITDLKTGKTPSYLGEYRSALTIFRSLKLTNTEETALKKLFFEERDPGLRSFVIAELIALQLAHGGFRFLGYANYKGFMGGPFGDPKSMPYRGLRSE